MMPTREFVATLEPVGPDGKWTRVDLPFSVEEVFGKRGRVSVRGTINGEEFRTSIFPNGDGTHHLMVNKAMMLAGQARQGTTARFVVGLDTEPRIVEIPEELAQALARDDVANAAFQGMPPSHQKEHIGYITEAKKPETRARRVEKTLERLRQREAQAKK